MVHKCFTLAQAAVVVGLLLTAWAPVICEAGETAPPITSLSSLIERYDSSSCKECHEEIYGQWEKISPRQAAYGIE